MRSTAPGTTSSSRKTNASMPRSMEIGGQPHRNPERKPWRYEEDTIRRGHSLQRSRQPMMSWSKSTQQHSRCHRTPPRSEMITTPRLSANVPRENWPRH
ncbi:unnamed protein product [Microthlaspi erraticum]|uniref:Uncharacterized protein n=1 Tax=Microthlaspi erraticum TaxID=1685480 RepID=A0A6D2I4R7_9BRAS|nr:unnamed protein product [Microthlaspi erraticum]